MRSYKVRPSASFRDRDAAPQAKTIAHSRTRQQKIYGAEGRSVSWV